MFILRVLSWTIINPSVSLPAPRWRPFARLTWGGRERRWSPPLFSDGRRKGWKIKEDPSSARSTKLEPTPRQPLASAPSFEGVDRRGALSDCRKRDAHSFDNTPGVHLAAHLRPRETVFCRFLERACFIFCAGSVCHGARWSGNKWSIARSERRKACVWKLLFFANGQKCRSTVRDYL